MIDDVMKRWLLERGFWIDVICGHFWLDVDSGWAVRFRLDNGFVEIVRPRGARGLIHVGDPDLFVKIERWIK